MKVITKNIDKLSKQLSKSVKSHAESAATLVEESKRIAKASRTHAKQVKNLKKLKRRGENLTKLANALKNDALLEDFALNHRRLDHLSPMQRYDSYNKALSSLSPSDRRRFKKMYKSRHFRLPTKRRALLEERELRTLEQLSNDMKKESKLMSNYNMVKLAKKKRRKRRRDDEDRKRTLLAGAVGVPLASYAAAGAMENDARSRMYNKRTISDFYERQKDRSERSVNRAYDMRDRGRSRFSKAFDTFRSEGEIKRMNRDSRRRANRLIRDTKTTRDASRSKFNRALGDYMGAKSDLRGARRFGTGLALLGTGIGAGLGYKYYKDYGQGD